MRVPRLPGRGETVTDGLFLQTYGGKGANQAVAAARAGARAAFIACVGADYHGDAMAANFARDGLDLAGLKRSPSQPSGSALVMIERDGMNYLTVAPGANLDLFHLGEELAARHGVPLRHETHRGRALFCAPAALAFLRALPGLQLTADLSHWVCVHESDLSDQPVALEAALEAARHIHARVGFDQGPQVSDPRNPALAPWLERFLGWWNSIRDRRRAAGAGFLTIAPEFGPAPYMPLRGASPKPVGDAWEYNRWMLALLRRHLG